YQARGIRLCGRGCRRRRDARRVLPHPARAQCAAGHDECAAMIEQSLSLRPRAATDDPPLAKILLVVTAAIFIGLFLLMPLSPVFAQALAKGLMMALNAIREPDALSAIQLTFLVAGIAVPMNVVFGLAASWAITKFDFIGKSFLLTLIDLPFSVSPVI